MATWQLQTAKAKLSELLRAARAEGPQIISVRGAEEFLVIRKADVDPSGAPRRIPQSWDELYAPVQGAGDKLLLPERALDSLRELQLAEDLADWDSEQ